MKALINVTVYDFKRFIKDAYIIFDEVIQEVGLMKDFNYKNIELINCDSSIVMPGLVNGYTKMSNIFLNTESCIDKDNFKNDKICNYYSSLLYGVNSIKSGVTTIIDGGFENIQLLNVAKKAICDGLSLRGIFSFNIKNDLNIEKYNECNGNLAIGYNLENYIMSDDDSLNYIEKHIKDLPTHINLAENIENVAAHMAKYEKRIVERLNEFGILKSKTLLANCNYLSDREAQLLNEKDIYVCLCPSATMEKGFDILNYSILDKYGIPCMVGTNGLGANVTREFLNLVYAMRNKHNNEKSFCLSDLISVINNNYKYVNHIMNIKIGKIEEGYKSDLIIVPYNEITNINEENIIKHVFYNIFDNFTPKDVLCNGKFVMRNYDVIYQESKPLN